VKGFSEVTRDITDRKKAEMALQESEKKYRMLFEGIRNGIVLLEAIYDADGNICDARYLEMNKIYQVYTGLTRDKAKGRTVMEMLPGTQKSWFDTLDIAIKKGKLIRFEMYHEGTQKHYAVSAYSPGGNMVVGVFRDITREKETEQEKLKMRERLNRSQKMEAMGLMAGSVAHDLNNLLSSVISYPELLLMNPLFPDKFRRPVERIKEGGLRAAAIVSDMLTIARGVASRKEIAGINGIISDYLDSFEHQEMLEACPDIVIETALEESLHNISCSPVHIRKVLMNLVSNAIESAKTGGKIVISTRNQSLERPIPGYDDVRAGAYVLLSVADTGGGVLPEDMPHIFEPFYSKKKMGRSGTGLGLTVVWNTVEDHQGYIRVDSGANGTRFDLYFPASGLAAGNAAEPLDRASLIGCGQKILVVDDEAIQREIARHILTELGYQVETMDNGEKTLVYLQSNAVDVLVLDMVLGSGMNGRETYQEILRIRPGQKAIIVSGYAETEEVREAQRLGAGAFVKKPYTIDAIGAAVKAELLK
jgi:PAS domain S-box-containing protein